MKLLYISCHQILEYDEVKLFSEMGHDVFSTGTYANPNYREGMARPGIKTLTHYPELERLASTVVSSNGIIPIELIDWADTIVFMHQPEWIRRNWATIKHKRVIFRSIGQCVGGQEKMLQNLRALGVEIVRYSPAESRLPNYAGADAVIRFYKDESYYWGYNGVIDKLLNITQSLTDRATYVQKDEIMAVANGLPFMIYGFGNGDMAESGGELNYDDQLWTYRNYRAYIYGGTWPAPYTLSFIEAMMTGIPIIAIGPKHVHRDRGLDFYEVPQIIENEYNGFVSDDLDYLHGAANDLLLDVDYAHKIGSDGRDRAIELFGKDVIKQKWEAFL